MGDVTHIYDMSGNLCAKYVYDAWGNHQIETNINDIATINPIRYRGYYYDTETGLYYLQTRYYDPEIGRFMTIDDLAYLDPDSINGLNLYAYCGNNPIMYSDPLGHFAITSFLIGLAVATLIGAAVGGASYAIGQGINYLITGDFEWSWGGFWGSIIGGAIGGAVAYIPGMNVIFGTALSGLATTLGTMLGENISGDANHSCQGFLF